MSALQTPTGSPRAGLGLWFPLALIAIVAAAVATLRLVTNKLELDPAVAATGLVAGVILSWIILLLWLLFANMPRRRRFVGLFLVVTPVVLLCSAYRVEDVRTSGGMVLLLRPRFGGGHTYQGTANQSLPQAIDLRGDKPTDWAQYRGRDRAGVVFGSELNRDWASTPPRLLWKHPIGGGHSPFAVVGTALFTLEQRDENEAITCYDADTGTLIWAFTYRALFDERMGDKGPRSTPTIVDGEVFALGATGMLTCLDARTGTAKWGPVNVLASNGNIEWGLSGSPLVVDGEVLVNAGVQAAAAPHGTIIAFDRHTGKTLWSTSSRAHAGYSSPMLATLAGKRQLLLLDGDGLAGYEFEDAAAKGQELWRFPWKTHMHINVAQPLVLDGDRVFITSGYGGGCTMLHVTTSNGKWSAEPLWKKSTLGCKFSSPVYFQGHIYGLNNEWLTCIDAETGNRKSRGLSYDFGQVLLCKDVLLVSGEWGELAVVDTTPGELRELGRVQALSGRSWNPAAVADGRVYWRNNREMVGYEMVR